MKDSFNPREFLERLFYAAVQSAQPEHNILPHLPSPPKGRTVILGAGKAAAAMAFAVEASWPRDAPLSGLVVTRYGHAPKRPGVEMGRVEITEAAHPVPDENGLTSARRIMQLAQSLTSDDLALCLISGGGSSLLTLPAAGLDMNEKQRINRHLLLSGANIAEMNCVRKHLSQIKGGRLAAACHPAKVVTLAISDVPGDDPCLIASGPTVPDPSTCTDALAIIDRYAIEVSPRIRAMLLDGTLETPKPHQATMSDVRVIATPRRALEAAATAAREAGISAHILSDCIEGESSEVAKVHAAVARQVAREGQPFSRPCVLLSGGETTVTMRRKPQGHRPGRGGRAGEFCLSLAQSLRGERNIWALAADTDGIDGVENNAGAFVAPDTLSRAAAGNLSASEFLARHDSYGYFSALNDLVVSGPTYTNVNDFRALLIL